MPPGNDDATMQDDAHDVEVADVNAPDEDEVVEVDRLEYGA